MKQNNQKTTILHLPISYEKILKMKKNVPEYKKSNTPIDQVKGIQNDINEYKSTIDVIRGKTYDVIIKPEINLLHNTINSKDFKNTKTDIVCWWCTYSFSTTPLGSPNKYIQETDSFRVTGCFCSFNCILAYKMSKGHMNCQLVSYMHKKLTNEFKSIIKAPLPYCLEKFGGSITIDKYRESFLDGSFIKILHYPMIFIPMNIIEGKPIDLIQKSMDKMKMMNKEPLMKIKTSRNINIPIKQQNISKQNTIDKILGFSSCV